MNNIISIDCKSPDSSIITVLKYYKFSSTKIDLTIDYIRKNRPKNKSLYIHIDFYHKRLLRNIFNENDVSCVNVDEIIDIHRQKIKLRTIKTLKYKLFYIEKPSSLEEYLLI